MIVEKYRIPDPTLIRITSRAQSAETFTTAQLQALVEEIADKTSDGSLRKRAMRLADRLTTKWKTEGRIVKSNATGRAVWAWKAGAK